MPSDEVKAFRKQVEKIRLALNAKTELVWTDVTNPGIMWEFAQLRRTDGLEISFQEAGKDRIEVSGVWPRNSKGAVITIGEPITTITVGRNRGPDEIAKEIYRRLLPEFQIQHEKALKQIESTDAIERRTNDTAAAVRGILNAKEYGSPTRFVRYRGTGGLRVTGRVSVEDVHVEIDGTLDAMRPVLEAIARANGGSRSAA